jgi:2-isopropylmalate synthase
MKKVTIYDTTLRDGTQAEDISFSAEDKIKIAVRLDKLGVQYIEGGWPGSNPKDMEFFKKIKDVSLEQARIAAFGSTCRAGKPAKYDANIKALLEADTPVVTIFGKCWDLHVERALRTTLEENLRLITDSIDYVKKQGKEVIFDAEHFFDGYADNPEYAVKTLEAAEAAGAELIVLCDTNGGTLTHDLGRVIARVKKVVKTPLGIHCHNDSGLAVANSLEAVRLGSVQVQGTFNGYGERCGNADLCSIIPAMMLKMKLDSIPRDNLVELTHVSHYVSELANEVHNKKAPYVGESAFAHKGGVHVSAMLRDSRTYEHILPETVGNHRRVLVSDLSGRANILAKAEERGIDLSASPNVAQEVVAELKELEHLGYQYEAAEDSLELLIKKRLGEFKDFFKLEGFRVIIEKRSAQAATMSEATIKVSVDDIFEHTAADGDGPVSALDNALRKSLEKFFPEIQEMHLRDYKVRVLDASEGTAAKVRVLIESQDQDGSWGTVGVSENLIEASWQALVDSIHYFLMKKRNSKNNEAVQ